MEENKKFRNHISIIVEQAGGSFVALAAVLLVNFAQEIDKLTGEDLNALADRSLPIGLGVAAVLVLLVGNRVFVWAKTWICIEENAVVIERNTVNKKKNTIGIQNISNINLEQNLFEMLLGTCKVKLDTNSRSTADSTDVKIVIRKKEAEEFRRIISAKMLKLNRTEPADETLMQETAVKEETFDIRADGGDILAHGLYSVNIFSVLVLIVCIAGTVVNVSEIVGKQDMMKSLLGVASSLLVSLAVILSAVWDTVKDFVRYYDFRAKRISGRIYIKYGLFKKAEYIVPADKIQALRIRQSLIARIAGRYMAEVINVGMGDEKEEKNSFLALYGTKEQLEQKIRILLPEFSGSLQQEIERVPASAWAARVPSACVYCGVTAAAATLCVSFFPGYALPVWGCAGAMVLFLVLGMFLSFVTCGAGAGNEFLNIASGYFGRTVVAVRYKNIQYAEFKQNFIARKVRIKKGTIHLLASSTNTEHNIPYFKEGMEEIISKNMIL